MSGANSALFIRHQPGGMFSMVDMLRSKGNYWFVNSATGANAAGAGRDPDSPFLTIAYAVAAASAYDTIVLMEGSSFSEAVTCSLAGIRFIGNGPCPKAVQWTAPTVAASFCLKPSANYISVENIYFKPVIYVTSGVPSALRLSGSNWLTVENCRFQGQTDSYTAIYSPVCDSDNVHILDCEFYYLNTATNGCAILGVEAGGLSYSGWVIERCKFHSCLKGVDINGRACTIMDCIFAEYGINPAGAIAQLMTTGIDLSGTSSGCNVVTRNHLPGDYSTARFVAGASGDSWVGNFCDDVAEAEVGDNGISIANPAA